MEAGLHKRIDLPGLKCCRLAAAEKARRVDLIDVWLNEDRVRATGAMSAEQDPVILGTPDISVNLILDGAI